MLVRGRCARPMNALNGKELPVIRSQLPRKQAELVKHSSGL